MATGAHYQINQATNAVPTGTTDIARIDLRQSQTIHFVGDSSSGQTSPAWLILSWPFGSARAQMTNPATFDATYSPDVPGTYTASFLVNDGIGANAKRFVFVVTQDSAGIVIDDNWREPGYGEQTGDDNVGGNDRGYAKAYESANTKGDITIATIAALRLTKASRFKRCRLLAYSVLGDGGGGAFYWDAASSAADNAGTVIAPTGLATGRWIRQYEGALNVRWFGAKGDNATDDTTAILNAIASLGSQGGTVWFPRGIYLTTGISLDRTTYDNIHFVGEGKTEPGLTTNGTIIRAYASQAYVWRSAGRNLTYENLSFDGNFLTTAQVFLFDYQTFGCHMDRCGIFRTFQYTPIALTSIDASANTFTKNAHGLVNGDRIYFTSTGNIPAGTYGAVAGTYNWVFFVVSATTNTFQVSITSGGAALDITDVGTGTVSVTKVGADLLRLGGASNLQVDTGSISNCYIRQDPNSFTNLAGTCLRLFGSNTVLWHFDSCHFQGGTDVIYVQGGGARFTNCAAWPVVAVSRASILKDGASSVIEWDAGYEETDAVPLVVCINSPGADAGQAWRISKSYFNAGRAHINWDCRQPLFLNGNTLGGNVNITATGGMYVTSIGDTFNDQIAMDFTGATGTRLIRLGNAHATTGLQGNIVPGPFRLPGLPGTGLLTSDANGNVTSQPTKASIGTAVVPTNQGEMFIDYDGTPSTGGAMYVAVNANSYGWLWNYDNAAKYLRSGKFAGFTRFNATTGGFEHFTAPSGTAGNAVTLTQAMAVTSTAAAFAVPVTTTILDSAAASDLILKRNGVAKATFGNARTDLVNDLTSSGSNFTFGHTALATNFNGWHVGVNGFAFDHDNTAGGAFRIVTNANQAFISGNEYTNAGTKYARTGGAARINIDTTTGASAGDISFYTAPSGTADTAITETLTFTIKRNGGGFIIGAGSQVKGHLNVTSGSLAFGTVGAQASVEVSVTVTGAAVGDTVSASPNGDPSANLVWCARVSAADTVKVRLTNVTGAGIASTNQTWSVDVWKH